MALRTFVVEEFKRLKDGLHEGVIIGIEYRELKGKDNTTYEYMDVLIESEGLKCKVGFPAKFMPTNKTGVMMAKFGCNLDVGVSINPEETLIGKKCAFVSFSKVVGNNTYANIQPDSLRHVQ